MSALSIRNMNQTLGEIEQIEWAKDHKAYVMSICQEIRDLLGQEAYNAWWETTSEARFEQEAEIKLLQLKRNQNDFDDEYFRIDKQIEALMDGSDNRPSTQWREHGTH